MSLYKSYVEEQLSNRFVHEDEFGFITYNFQGHMCQLEEIYIIPEHRRKGIASKYYKMMEEIAKENDCDMLLGSIVIGTNNAEESMQCLFKNNFKLYQNNGNMIYLIKELGE